MAFDLSQVQVLQQQPWRYTTQPVYGNGPMEPPTVAGVKETLTGVFVLLSPELLAYLKEIMTAAQKTALDNWTRNWTEADCAMWSVPVWAGNGGASYVQVPANVWNNFATAPPNTVKVMMRKLYRDEGLAR